MDRPTEGCCGTCGYLSRRAKITQVGGPRDYRSYTEVEPHERDEPRGDLQFVPHGTNSKIQGEFACYRHHADLAKEIRDDSSADTVKAGEAVIWKDRHCPRWSKYEPGIAPSDQLQEAKARAFEEERQAFARKIAEFERRQVTRQHHEDRRLTKAAIWLASIIGAAQLIASFLTMGKDAMAYRGISAAYCWISHLFT